jgi:thioredoxin 1
MATQDLTAATFEQTVNDNDIVLIDFWADWCGPCHMFAPTYKKVSDKHPDIVFGKVDTQHEQELAGMFGIQSIPTIAVLRDGVLLFKQAGVLPEEALEDIIAQVREVDMAEVHRQIAEQQAS